MYLLNISLPSMFFFFFFFNDTATTEIYTLSLHDALPISRAAARLRRALGSRRADAAPHRPGGRRCDLGGVERGPGFDGPADAARPVGRVGGGAYPALPAAAAHGGELHRIEPGPGEGRARAHGPARGALSPAARCGAGADTRAPGGATARAGPAARRRSCSCLNASRDRKSTRLNSSHGYISYAVF